MAQLGFIVVTLGNRGGHPDRSKYYHNYGCVVWHWHWQVAELFVCYGCGSFLDAKSTGCQLMLTRHMSFSGLLRSVVRRLLWSGLRLDDDRYGNLRDYGLADKKTVLEQLGDRHTFIDMERIGIYGHSGGGFMSTAAMLVYPDFFKVAVSSSGNHEVCATVSS